MKRALLVMGFFLGLALLIPLGTWLGGQERISTPGGVGLIILGQPLKLTLEKLSLADCADAAKTRNAQPAFLVAGGQTIPGSRAGFTCSETGELIGTASTSIAGNGGDSAKRREAWQAAFNGFFSLTDEKELLVAFGPATGGMSTVPQAVSFLGTSAQNFAKALTFFILLITLHVVLFWFFFGRAPVKSFAGVPPPKKPYDAPYSLSRFQLLWWSGIVTASYGTILTITGSMDTITTGTMTLMGIVGGTSIIAAFQDNRTGDSDGDAQRLEQHRLNYLSALAANPQNQALMDASLAALYPPSDKRILPDLVMDEGGYNVHRLQLLIWTVVLGIAFVYEVFHTLGMPELSSNLLALTGISNGTYIGLKTQEKQVVAAPTPTPVQPPPPPPPPSIE